jgi:hypothetical protein
MNYENRRQNNRVLVEIIATEIRKGRQYSPCLTDISEEGILLENPATQNLPQTATPTVELLLPGIPSIIYARCKTLRDSSDGFFRQRALQFIDISPVDRDHVRCFVHGILGLC